MQAAHECVSSERGARRRTGPGTAKRRPSYFFSTAVITASVPSFDDPAITVSVRFLSPLSATNIPPCEVLVVVVSKLALLSCESKYASTCSALSLVLKVNVLCDPSPFWADMVPCADDPG